MKKLLFFIPNLAHGGAERVLVNLVNNLNPDKYDITVKTIFDYGVYQSDLKSHIHYEYIFKHLFRGSTTLFKMFSPEWLYRHIIKSQYDIIVSYLEGPTARILSGCQAEHTKKISWIHIEMNEKREFRVGFRTCREALGQYQRFDYNVCVSKTVKDKFCSYGPEQDKTLVLYNTNETDQIRERAKEKTDDWEFPEEEIKICSVGKIVESKGFDRLADVLGRLKRNGIKAHVYILGIGEEQAKIIQYLKKNHLEDSFTFLGFRKNPFKYMALCDLYVCSSRKEGFSTAVTEALILGLPIVSTCCSGAKEMLGDHNEYGIVTENNTESLYQGVYQMLRDEKVLEHYKKQAEKRGHYFSRGKTVRAVEELLDF